MRVTKQVQYLVWACGGVLALLFLPEAWMRWALILIGALCVGACIIVRKRRAPTRNELLQVLASNSKGLGARSIVDQIMSRFGKTATLSWVDEQLRRLDDEKRLKVERKQIMTEHGPTVRNLYSLIPEGVRAAEN